MLAQRSEGLRRLLLIGQIWITTGRFWLGVWVMVKFYSPPGALTWRRYSIYCVLLVLGLTLEYRGRDSSRDYPLKPPAAGTWCQSAADGRQYRDARHLPDRDQGRFYFASFPFSISCLVFTWRYFSHITICRPFWPAGFFKGIRREKTLLVRSPARAQLRNWLRQKSEIGLHTAGLISQETFEQAGDLPILGQFGDFDRIVHECGATQVILLEFPGTKSDRQSSMHATDSGCV
jgi:hypothetical protein